MKKIQVKVKFSVTEYLRTGGGVLIQIKIGIQLSMWARLFINMTEISKIVRLLTRGECF